VELGLTLVMLGGGGGGVIVKFTPLLAKPPMVITTFPVVAPLGTGTTMLVSLQLVGKVWVPLNATVLFVCDGPKPVPVIVTEVPTTPDAGFRLVMVAAESVVALAVLE
jgi:hypothetical protein